MRSHAGRLGYGGSPRPEHLSAAGVTVTDVHTILDAVATVLEPVRLLFFWRPTLKDPGDEMVLETAISGGADRLVTFNLRHLGEAAREFGMRAVAPGEAWREVRERKHEKK